MYWVSKYDQHRNLSSSKLTSRNPTNSSKWTPSNLEQPQIAHFESNPQGVRVSSHKPQCLSDIQTRSNLPIESSFADNSSLQHAYLILPSHVSEHVWVAYFLWPILKVFSSTQNSGGGPWFTTSPFECRASSSLFGLGFRNCSGTSSPAPFHQWTW